MPAEPVRPDPGAAAATPDERLMARALALATRGWGQVAPNPLVGAVIAHDGEVVGEGAHRRFGQEHAEVEALRAAGTRARGATLYVTLEPCTHAGKTPPCVDAILAAGIARAVVAIRDPNPGAGGGIERLRAAGVEVSLGPGAEAAAELNAPFLNAFRSDRPWVTLKLALSLDGAIAAAGESTTWLTGPGSRRRVHLLRAGSDAVGVGMGTVLADDPWLTVRDVERPRVTPLRVVFSRSGRLPLTSRLAQRTHEAPVLVFANAPDPSYDHALRGQGVEVATAASLQEALRLLAARGVRSLLVEGGANLASALLNEDLVDRIILIRAPILLGEGALPGFRGLASTNASRRWRPLSSEWIDDDHLVVLAPGRGRGGAPPRQGAGLLMFTGLVEAVGQVEGAVEQAAGRELRVSCPWSDLEPGDSVALNGACLTVRECGDGWFTVAAVATTMDRTTIGAWVRGTRVNLERALRLGDRLGGHLVQGHVDGVGTVRSVARRESALVVDIAVPAAVGELLVPHGAITVDGVSLTVNALPAAGVVQVSLIEWTERQTTLGTLQAGTRVHLEADVVGKYVRALLAPYQAPRPGA